MNQPLGVSSTLHLPESQAPEVTLVQQNVFRTVCNGLKSLHITAHKYVSKVSRATMPTLTLLAPRTDEQDCMISLMQTT